MKTSRQKACVALLGLVVAGGPVFAGDAPPPAPEKKEGARQFLRDLLPLAWQKNPQVRFNVYTEMMPEGRKRRAATPEQPVRYYAAPARFSQLGWSIAAGEKPPPGAQLEAALREVLTRNGYLALPDEGQRPDLLLVFSFGSSGTDPIQMMTEVELGDEPNPTSADKLVHGLMHDPTLFRDVIERARFVAGNAFARELQAAISEEFRNRVQNLTLDRLPIPPGPGAYWPVSPDLGSPLQVLMGGGKGGANRNLVELAFHTVYFVTATAFDFAGVEKKQRIPLWQTRMVVDAQGVDMAEVLRPLILHTGDFIGRETPEMVIVTKRLDREGRVEIGEAKVVEEPKPGAAAPAGKP